jgi:ferredoxin/flavodoxin
MRPEIYYFTGTGNSYIVAKVVANKINGILLPVKETEDKQSIVINAPITGIVFPAYYMHLPRIIERFLNKLDKIENKYLFIIVTVGGIAGDVLFKCQKIIESRGGIVSGAFVVRMPANYIDAADSLPEFFQKIMFWNMKHKVGRIVSYITENKTGKVENFNPLGTFLFSKYITREFNSGKFLPGIDSNFWIDSKCTFCAICVKICPVNNIQIENRSVKWKGNCEKCLACIQWCPEAAIQFNNKTRNRKRYHHPDMTIREMMSKSIYINEK